MTIAGRAFDIPIFRRLLGYVSPYKTVFWITAFLTVVLAFLSPVRPWLIQQTLDGYILAYDSKGLLIMTLLLLALLVAEGIIQFFQSYYTTWLGQTVIRDLRVSIFRHIINFNLKYFDRTPIGTLVTRVISDIETIADVFSEGLLTMLGDILKLIVIVIVMFITDWQLTLICLSLMPFLVISTYIFKTSVQSAFQEVRTQVARLNAFVQEHITGMGIVQIFNREEQELKSFKKINAEHRDAHIRSVWAYSVFFPVVEILSAMSVALVIWWGAKEVINETMTFGVLLAFILYIHMLYRPIRQLADRFNALQMGMVSSERVFKILDSISIIENKGRHPESIGMSGISAEESAEKIKGNISFKNIWFAYNIENSHQSSVISHQSKNENNIQNPEWILRNVSFEVKQGETLALVGATGAGKTSIINLLNRFYEFQKGEILIDGINIRDYELHELRKSIGLVLQEVFLFSDSILNNITLKNDSITIDRVIEASKVVGAHEFILRLPGNYHYNVMERGAMLSSGQRQLIAFIRAYVYNPKILVLDEATSSIDTESEQLIQYATARITENRTSIIIAHRLATIQKADKILVMEKGEIVESGNHQELLRKSGQYKRLFELQFKD